MKWSAYIITPIFLLFFWTVKYYYASIKFEIVDDEIHVNRGIISKSRKIVPYRTITNIDIRRGPFDRIFGIGTVEIQTAGFSGSAGGKGGPEEKLDGITYDDLELVQRTIINRVRRIKGSPATSQDSDTESDVFTAILHEIKELRSIISSKLKSD